MLLAGQGIRNVLRGRVLPQVVDRVFVLLPVEDREALARPQLALDLPVDHLDVVSLFAIAFKVFQVVLAFLEVGLLEVLDLSVVDAFVVLPVVGRVLDHALLTLVALQWLVLQPRVEVQFLFSKELFARVDYLNAVIDIFYFVIQH